MIMYSVDVHNALATQICLGQDLRKNWKTGNNCGFLIITVFVVLFAVITALPVCVQGKGRRKDKGRCSVLEGRIYSIPCRAGLFCGAMI